MDKRLTELLAKLKERSLPGDEYLKAEMAVTRFIADLPPSSRVFCRGDVHNPDKPKNYPAVLTYNTVSRQTKAWAPSGRKGAMECHHEAYFWSRIPHVGIAQEALMGPETMTVPAQ